MANALSQQMTSKVQMFFQFLMLVEDCLWKKWVVLAGTYKKEMRSCFAFSACAYCLDHPCHAGGPGKRANRTAILHPVQQNDCDVQGNIKSEYRNALQAHQTRFHSINRAIKPGPDIVLSAAQDVLDVSCAMDDVLWYMVTEMFNAWHELLKSNQLYTLKE